MNFRKLIAFMILPLPSWLKVVVLRHLLGFRIGKSVRIGFSIFFPETCTIGDRARIGHFNYIARMKRLEIGSDVSIGHVNILLGGDAVQLGDGSMIGRFNEINSILNPLTHNPTDPRLIIGRRAVITAWHKVDFTDRITIGESAILAGRNSSLWTHNRQQGGTIEIGKNCYMGSGIQMAPGSAVGMNCVVGMGAIITKKITGDYKLIAGVPAKAIKDLDEESRVLVNFPTRPDLDMFDLDGER